MISRKTIIEIEDWRKVGVYCKTQSKDLGSYPLILWTPWRTRSEGSQALELGLRGGWSIRVQVHGWSVELMIFLLMPWSLGYLGWPHGLQLSSLRPGICWHRLLQNNIDHQGFLLIRKANHSWVQWSEPHKDSWISPLSYQIPLIKGRQGHLVLESQQAW